MKIIKTLSALILAATFYSNSAIAEGEKLSDKLSNTTVTVSIETDSCNADSAILCPGLPLNSQKSFMCLMAYEDNLSVDCYLDIVEAAIILEAGALAINHSVEYCEADADKYCLDIKPGEGRIVSCLKKNEEKLDKKCTAVLKDTGLWNLGK